MKNHFRQPLTIIVFCCLNVFAATGSASRFEMQMDTIQNTNVERNIVHGAKAANLSIGFALATIVSDYIMSALYNLSSVQSPVVLLVSAVIRFTSLILVFKGLEKTGTFCEVVN